jgi:hypothetical protein
MVDSQAGSPPRPVLGRLTVALLRGWPRSFPPACACHLCFRHPPSCASELRPTSPPAVQVDAPAPSDPSALATTRERLPEHDLGRPWGYRSQGRCSRIVGSARSGLERRRPRRAIPSHRPLCGYDDALAVTTGSIRALGVLLCGTPGTGAGRPAPTRGPHPRPGSGRRPRNPRGMRDRRGTIPSRVRQGTCALVGPTQGIPTVSYVSGRPGRGY